MLGKYVRIKVTHPIHSYSNEQGFTYELNYGEVEGAKQYNAPVKGAFIMGINHPVRSFDGRVIGIVHYKDCAEIDWIVAPKSTRFINIDIIKAIDFAVRNREHTLDCLYERSCGAVVYRYEDGRLMLLMLRHRHGGHWSFPKGHMEGKETEVETALREIREETGLDVLLQTQFRHTVEYYPKPGVKKLVVYFLGEASPDEEAIKQEEEIGELRWVRLDDAFDLVSFKNDRDLLTMARNRLAESNLI